MTFNLPLLRADINKKKGDRKACDVAKEIGISKATMSRIENNDGFLPDMYTFVLIIKWLARKPNRYF